MESKLKEKDWDQTEDDLERSRNKIQAALKAAKERSKKNSNLEDDIDTKFNQLQTLGIKLLDILRESGLDQQPDWLNLTENICQLLSPLEGSMPFMSSSEEREIRRKDLLSRQTSMMELTRVIGRKLLFEGKHNQAVLAAVQSLRFSIDVHGLNSVKLVPSYLILGEASIGLGKLTQADEYLAQAEWTVLKSRDSDDSAKSKLYRNLSRLHAAKGDFESALRLLAEDIYHGSKEWGTDDVNTAGGYFNMANVFFRQNKMDVADSLYDQVTDIWFEFLRAEVARKTADDVPESLLGIPSEDNAPLLDESQEAEAVQTLTTIFDIREQSAKQNHAAVSRICQTLSMLYFTLDDLPKAQEFGRKALKANEKVSANGEQILPNFLGFTNDGKEIAT